MLFELSDDQALLRDTSTRFVETELPLRRTREWHDEEATGLDRDLLRKAAELGWFAMLVPEQLGGGSISGDGLVDAAVIAEVLGANVNPCPFVAMNVVASSLATGGSPRTLTDVLSPLVFGDAVATIAVCDATGDVDRGAGLHVERVGTGLSLTGTRGFVPDAPLADFFLVNAELDGEPTQILVPADAPGLTLRPLASLDLSRRFAHLDLAGVTVPEDAVLSGGGIELDAQLRAATVLNLAETIGAMDALFEMTVSYAKDRIAFGRPIGSFQAIKHLLADQAVYLETAKAATAAAVIAVSRDTEDAAELVSMAAAYVLDQGNELAQDCLQVHGGIGYTWEHDLHLYLRRIRSNSSLFGDPAWHRERLCVLAGLGEDP